MKLFQLDNHTYYVRKDYGNLRPFSEVSLLAQILTAVRELDEGSRYVTFSKEEETQIDKLSEQVVGGLYVNQGLGHERVGVGLLLTPLLSPSGSYLTQIPADGNGNQPITEIKDWLLAIHRS